jgi:2,4-dienoyl-CoA reductase-like NADH-dependent reductase (Old Yellow Enzyme family)
MTSHLAQALPLARGPALANRLWLAPLTNWQSHDDGTLGEDEYRWLMARAAGGFGLVMTCAAHVTQGGQGFPGQLGAWSDAHLPGLARLARGIRTAGGVSALQLQHSGWRSDRKLNGGLPLVSPWPDEAKGVHVLSTAEIEALVHSFIAAALRGQQAGFDGVELHGAHGYLLSQFLDAQRNQRNDHYGGSFDNRVRVLLQALDGIRAATGPQFQLGLRLSPEMGGVGLADALRLAALVMGTGRVDYLDWSLWDVFKRPKEAAFQDKTLLAYCMEVPRGTARVGVAGNVLSAATAQACLDAGADFVLVGRGAIIHADFARRALADPGFTARAKPVPRQHLQDQGVGPRFMHYLSTAWTDFVLDDAVSG